jgi:HEAT repeat protein
MLGDFGKGDKTAMAALTEALKDEDAGVRNAASNALRRIDPEAVTKTGVTPPPP